MQHAIRLIVIIACISGYTAILLSQTRGVWLALPVLAIIFACINYKIILKNTRFLIIIASTLIVLSSAYISTTENNIIKRTIAGVINSKNAIHEYYNVGNISRNLTTSMGERIELWDLGYELFINNIMFGVGYNHYNKIVNEKVSAQHYPQSMNRHHGAHNEILHVAAEMGIIGITSFLIFILLPLIVFVRLYKSYNVQHYKAYSLSGVLLITAYMLFGLTDTVFISFTSQHFYIFILCCIFSLLRNKTVHNNG